KRRAGWDGLLQDVAVELLDPEREALPCIRPAAAGFDALSWLRAHRTALEQLLLRHGGMVFRGFGINGVTAFNQVALELVPSLLEYVHRSTPRTRLGGRIYTATEYPQDKRILLHSESSYTDVWPTRLLFYSAVVAQSGGETVVADSRRVHEG